MDRLVYEISIADSKEVRVHAKQRCSADILTWVSAEYTLKSPNKPIGYSAHGGPAICPMNAGLLEASAFLTLDGEKRDAFFVYGNQVYEIATKDLCGLCQNQLTCMSRGGQAEERHFKPFERGEDDVLQEASGEGP